MLDGWFVLSLFRYLLVYSLLVCSIVFYSLDLGQFLVYKKRVDLGFRLMVSSD